MFLSKKASAQAFVPMCFFVSRRCSDRCVRTVVRARACFRGCTRPFVFRSFDSGRLLWSPRVCVGIFLLWLSGVF